MENGVQIFTNQLFGSVRSIVDQYGNPWFVGKDVATSLGYNDTDQAIRKHVDIEDKWSGDGGVETTGPSFSNGGGNETTGPSFNNGWGVETTPHLSAPSVIDSLGRTQYPIWINESGLYSLIFGSKLPSAKEFKHWVTSQVLPMMRQIGFNRSIRLLQEENFNLKENNRILYQANQLAGNIALHNSSVNLDYKLLAYNVITSSYISDEEKKNMLAFDITKVNPEIDLDLIISDFKNKIN